MTYLTEQQIFDRVVAHARKQKCKSESTGYCLYRGPNGTKCFAGIFIPDDQYDRLIEGNVFDSLRHIRAPEIDPMDFFFVAGFQEIHDKYDVRDWEKRFKCMAKEMSLVYTPPEQEPIT